MNTEEANEIKKQYNENDEKFRTAKKRGDYKKASEYKSKRDALEAKFNEALKFLRENK